MNASGEADDDAIGQLNEFVDVTRIEDNRRAGRRGAAEFTMNARCGVDVEAACRVLCDDGAVTAQEFPADDEPLLISARQ